MARSKTSSFIKQRSINLMLHLYVSSLAGLFMVIYSEISTTSIDQHQAKLLISKSKLIPSFKPLLQTADSYSIYGADINPIDDEADNQQTAEHYVQLYNLAMMPDENPTELVILSTGSHDESQMEPPKVRLKGEQHYSASPSFQIRLNVQQEDQAQLYQNEPKSLGQIQKQQESKNNRDRFYNNIMEELRDLERMEAANVAYNYLSSLDPMADGSNRYVNHHHQQQQHYPNNLRSDSRRLDLPPAPLVPKSDPQSVTNSLHSDEDIGMAKNDANPISISTRNGGASQPSSEQEPKIVNLKMEDDNKQCMFLHSEEGIYEFVAPPEQVVSTGNNNNNEDQVARQRRSPLRPMLRSRRGLTFHQPSSSSIGEGEDVDVGSTGHHKQRQHRSAAPVCGLYILGDPNELISFEFEWFNVSCMQDGLLSFIDGWELNGQFFPNDATISSSPSQKQQQQSTKTLLQTNKQLLHDESAGVDHLVNGYGSNDGNKDQGSDLIDLLLDGQQPKLGAHIGQSHSTNSAKHPMADGPQLRRYHEFCGQSKPAIGRILKTSQNVGAIEFRIPKPGNGFRVRVRMEQNPEPCNVMLGKPEGTHIIRNYGRAINCSVSIMYPETFRILDNRIGKEPSAIHQQLKLSSSRRSIWDLRQQDHSDIFDNKGHSKQERLAYLYLLLSHLMKLNSANTNHNSVAINNNDTTWTPNDSESTLLPDSYHHGNYLINSNQLLADPQQPHPYRQQQQHQIPTRDESLGRDKADILLDNLRLLQSKPNKLVTSHLLKNFPMFSGTQGSDYLELLGGEGLDVNQMNKVSDTCRNNLLSSIGVLCGNTALRLVSSGRYNNYVKIDYRLNIDSDKSDYICANQYDSKYEEVKRIL